MKFLELPKLVLTTCLARELSPPLQENLREFTIFRGGGGVNPNSNVSPLGTGRTKKQTRDLKTKAQ